MGKGLAEFRKASDDFKRTWEREVAMEAAKLDVESENTILPTEQPQAQLEEKPLPEPLVKPAEPLAESAEPLVATTPEQAVARGSINEPLSPSPEPLSTTA